MRILAIIFILLWVSQVPYLYPHPFQPHEGIDALATDVTQIPSDIKEISGIKDKTADDIRQELMHELQLIWLKQLLFIIIGITSGLLLLTQKKLGRIMMLSFSMYLIAAKLFTIFSSENWRYYLSAKRYIIMFQYFPAQTVHQIITQAVLLVTIIILMSSFIRAKIQTQKWYLSERGHR